MSLSENQALVIAPPSRPCIEQLRTAISLALIVTIVATIAGCGGNAPSEAQAQQLEVTPTTLATPAETPALPSPSLPVTATSTPEQIQLLPSPEPEPTATIDDPFVADEPDRESQGDLSELDAPPPFDAAQFQERISDIIGAVDGELEVVVALPDWSVIYERDSTKLMESASLYKLAIMVELFRQRAAGELSFDDSIILLPDYFLEDDGVYGWESIGYGADLGSLVTNMISLSSNVAAAALLARLGNDAINATMADIGLPNTIIRWTPGIWVPLGASPAEDSSVDLRRSLAADDDDLDEHEERPTSERSEQALNVTTAEDVAKLLLMLLDGAVISPEASAEMLDLLSLQKVQDRLPRYLPEGTVVAHKTGNWDGLVHDAGVIWSPHGPIVVVVMTDVYDEGRAVELIAEIALEAYLLER